ncbi:MAG: PAS domain S-box protein [Bacteroidota bacterium]
MIKPSPPGNEVQRLEALRRYHILDTENDPDFDRLTQLASLICDAPISLITLIDENRQWFKSKVGIPISELPRDLSICQYVIEVPASIVIEDSATDERFREDPVVKNNPGVRFYAGYPLVDPSGYALGTLCVLDQKPKKLTPTQDKALQLIAGEAMSLIVAKRQKEELENFEKLFENSNDLICVAGTDGFLKKINSAFETLLGWDKHFLLESPFIDLVHPDDLEMTRSEMARLVSEGNSANFVNRIRTKKGDYKTLQWAGSPEPSTDSIFAIARDISNEKDTEEQVRVSENKFRSFFEYSQGLMCTHDMEGNFIAVNASGASLIGYTADEVQKMSLFDIVPEKHHHSTRAYLTEISKTGKSTGLMTTRHKNGSIRVWLYNNTTETDVDGNRYVIGNSIDITDRMNLERDLKFTKEILEQTNQMARVGAWQLSVESKKVYWSSITKEIHEVDDDFVPDLEKDIHFYKEGESRDKVIRAFNEAIEKGEPWDMELQIITAKGNERWVRAQGKADMENGKCKRVYGAFQDIDEQKRTKLALESSENKYHAFFDISPVSISIKRFSDNKFIDGNQALFTMTGYTEEEYRQLKNSDVTPAEYDEQEKKNYESLALTGRYGPYEKEYIHKDGHPVPILLNGIKFTGDDGEEQVYSVIQDISARKSAEKALEIEKSRLSAFVENAPAAVAMFDRDIKYIAVSDRWLEDYQLMGRNIIGLSHYEVFPNISKEWRDGHRRCLDGAVEKNDEDIWRPDGWDHDQHLRWEVRPWYLFDGTIGGIMIFTQDITEICLQREELRLAKKQAEQASTAKSEFLASMSHEIRTPLNGVIGFTDLILKTKLDETQQQYLSIVNQSANALLSIINDILDFSKIEAGKLELEIEKCDLYEIASQASDIISYQVKKKELEMLLNISTELPRFVWTDAVRLKQILINLLSNASKFTEKGEIELKIEALSDPMQKEITIRFEVRDTGIGINPENQKKIFQAFSQEDGTVTRRYGGTGLGLTISNKLLALMHSGLQLKSSPGNGSSFYFDLTLAAEQGSHNKWEDISFIKKVLIVDDNENNRTIVTQMLLLEGIHADVARNGIEALQILGTGKKYDVILMDYNMPIMDGLETIKKIRQNFYTTGAHQPIMLLSSSSDDDNVIRTCEELDVNIRLVKPIKMRDLYRSLAGLAKHREAHGPVKEISIEKNNSDPVRVLIAEDGEVNMLLAKTIIKSIAPNAVIIEATNGLIAVEACRQKLPDIIFMDIQMPEMNGYEATRKIRSLQHDSHIPIIAITAGNVKGEKEKCIDAGMDDFISKPIIESTVRVAFNKWIPVKKTTMETNHTNGHADTPHHGFKALRELVGDDPATYKEILELTRKEISQSLSDLEDKIAKKDLPAVKKAGHKLKGTALSSGLQKLSVLATRFEALDNFDEAGIQTLIQETKRETASALNLIDENIPA